MWLRGLNIDYARLKTAALINRNERTKEITKIWKDGFRRLKEENDNYQQRSLDDYRKEYAENYAWYQEQVAKGPPTY